MHPGSVMIGKRDSEDDGKEKKRYIFQTPNRCLRKWLGLEHYNKIKKLLKRQVNENE